MNQPKMSGGAGLAIEHLPVLAPVDSLNLEGILSVPTAARGVVLFAHGSGSSRHSPRNRYVADTLNESGLATLLIDLLTEDEQEVDLQTAHLRFDIPLLARRLEGITEWLVEHPEVHRLALGHFGPAGSGGGVGGCSGAACAGARRGFARRKARSCRTFPGGGGSAHASDRRRRRHGGHRSESPRDGAHAMRKGTAHYPRRHAFVRGAGSAAERSGAGARLVPEKSWVDVLLCRALARALPRAQSPSVCGEQPNPWGAFTPPGCDEPTSRCQTGSVDVNS